MTAAETSNLLTDNPALYEARFPDPDHIAARFVDDVLHAYLPRRLDPRRAQTAAVLDLGCGTGRDLGYLADQGYRCVGLDRSTVMVDYARRHYPGVSAALGDLRDFEVGERFDAVICLDSSLLYCHTDEELESCLRCCRAHLHDGGLLVAEMRNGAFFLGNKELLDGPTHSSVEWEGRIWQAETTLWIDHAAQLLRRRRNWHLPDSGEELVQTSAWRLLFPLELGGHLRRAGFEVRAMFDTPGPRAAGGWPPPSGCDGVARIGESAMSGDRMHVIAQAI